MITPSFALTATERVLPNLALDFTTASLDSRITFTRSGNTATVTNSSGNVVGINANLPRFDYDPIALTCKGLLIEEARTNLLTYASQYDQAGWSAPAGGLTITPNVTNSPDGTQDAYNVNKTNTGDSPLRKTITIANDSTTYTISTYLKQNTALYASVYGALYGGVTVALGCVLRWSDLALTNGAAKIVSVGNGWYRLSFQISNNSLANTNFELNLRCSGGDGFGTGAELGSNYFWGTQIEAGAFTSSFIPTAASTNIRNADTATITGTNFSNWYTATTGAAVVWSVPQSATGVRPLIQFDDTTALKIITLRGNIADPELYIVDTTAQAQIDAGTIVADTAYKLSGAWNTNNCAAAKDGGTVGTDVVATIPAPTQLRIGSDGTNYASAWVQKVMYWKQRIIDAEVQAISK
jgi:hypothetical protein